MALWNWIDIENKQQKKLKHVHILLWVSSKSRYLYIYTADVLNPISCSCKPELCVYAACGVCLCVCVDRKSSRISWFRQAYATPSTVPCHLWLNWQWHVDPLTVHNYCVLKAVHIVPEFTHTADWMRSLITKYDLSCFIIWMMCAVSKIM